MLFVRLRMAAAAPRSSTSGAAVNIDAKAISPEVSDSKRIDEIRCVMRNIAMGIPPEPKDVSDVKLAMVKSVLTSSPYYRLDSIGMVPVRIERDAKDEHASICRIGALFQVLIDVPLVIVHKSSPIVYQEVYTHYQYLCEPTCVAVAGPISMYIVNGSKAMRTVCDSMEHVIKHLKCCHQIRGAKFARVGVGYARQATDITLERCGYSLVSELYHRLDLPQPTYCAFHYHTPLSSVPTVTASFEKLSIK